MKILLLLLSLFVITTAQADPHEPGWDRPGMDYRSYEMPNPRAILCDWSCTKESRCKAWTYVKPGIQGPLARCWLKFAVPKPVRNNCCISGVK